MNRIFRLLLIGLLLIGCREKTSENNSTQKNYSGKTLEVYEEPMHKLVFEKDEVKILDVQINPNDTTQFHLHRYPMFYVSLGWQKGAEQAIDANWSVPDTEEWPNGEVASNTSYLTKPLVHRVTNVGSKVSRLIGIINLGKGLTTSLDSSEHETSNRWFRSKRSVLKSGEMFNFKNSKFPIVLVLVSGNEIKIHGNEAGKIDNKKWLYLDKKDTVINSNDNQIEVVQIEVLN